MPNTFTCIRPSFSRVLNPILQRPFASLPGSIFSSGCKIVYIWRDLNDVFVSYWFFMAKLDVAAAVPGVSELTFSLEERFDQFRKGLIVYGPYWDHVLGYWKGSLENPNKVLFLKYEDMKKNTRAHVKELADFLGCPFREDVSRLGFDAMKSFKIEPQPEIECPVQFVDPCIVIQITTVSASR